MRTPISTRTSVISVACALSLWAGPVHAAQLAISEPAPVSVFEKRLGLVTLEFELVNTGVPEFQAIEIKSISQFVAAISGDTTREVLATSMAGPCKRGGATVTTIFVGDSCKVSSDYFTLDADPFDTHAIVDEAKWTGGILVTWSFFGQTTPHVDAQSGFVTIKDDPVPEPSTWAMMLAGFAGLGAALRYLRRRAARACDAKALSV